MLDSDDDEYLLESELAALDFDDTGNLQFYFLLCNNNYEMFYILYIFLGKVDENALDEDEASEIEDDDDEDEESEMPVSRPVMTAKDGTKWAETPTSKHQVAMHNIVQQRCGPNRNTNMLSNLDTLKLFFTPEVADIIIHHMNKKTISTNETYNQKNPGKKK